VTTGFETWTRWHAALVLLAFGVALFLGRAWPVAACALASLAAFNGTHREAWWISGRFNWANAVTALRVGIVWALAARLHGAPNTLLAVIVLGLFALDGLDGWLAERFQTKSEFGALFDMETDAFFVLTVELVLFQRGELGPWILVTGVLRYVYVLVRAFVPARRADVPRSRFGRHAFSALAMGLFFAFALPGAIGAASALVGTALVTWSFARSFYDSYAPSVRAGD
jgi:phosphatidylglycerophosphate synthase